MSETEYKQLVYLSASISEMLTEILDEDGQELFEAYGRFYEQIVQYETLHCA